MLLPDLDLESESLKRQINTDKRGPRSTSLPVIGSGLSQHRELKLSHCLRVSSDVRRAVDAGQTLRRTKLSPVRFACSLLRQRDSEKSRPRLNKFDQLWKALLRAVGCAGSSLNPTVDELKAGQFANKASRVARRGRRGERVEL